MSARGHWPFASRAATVDGARRSSSRAEERSTRHDGASAIPDGAPISVAQLRQISCDAGIIPVVLGADSIPTHYGPKRYTVPGNLRRAVVIRDGWKFLIPRRPNTPRHCHHIKAWEHGGKTHIDNLASLYAYHHRWIHQGHEHHITPVKGSRPRVHRDHGPAP